MSIRICITIFFTLLIISCGKKAEPIPADIIDPEKMRSLFTDLHLAQASISVNTITDTAGFKMNDYQEYILNKHRIGKTEFLNSLRYYTQRPELMQVIYDSVMLDLTKIQGETQRQ